MTRHNTARRLLAFLLCFVLCTSLLPAAALAEAPQDTAETESNTEAVPEEPAAEAPGEELGEACPEEQTAVPAEELIPAAEDDTVAEDAAVLDASAFTAGEETITYINPLYADEITEAMLLPPAEAPAAPAGLGGVSALSVDYNGVTYEDTVAEAAAGLREGLKARQQTVTVYYYEMAAYDSATAGILFDAALAHTGVPTEGDYLAWQYGGYSATISRYASSVRCYYTITYTITYYTTAEQEAELSTRLNAIMASLNLSGSDALKVLAIYNYITQNVSYDYTNLGDSSYKLKHTAYAALINGTAVCQGYAVLFYRMALTAGVDTRLIPGTASGGGHGWNIVKIGDLYYNVDATWDAGRSSYLYFLRCDANFTGHTRDEEYRTEAFYTAYPMGEADYVITTVALVNGEEYTSLDAAVEAAAGGDTIRLIASGTYTLPDFNKDLVIRGEAENVVINAEGVSAATLDHAAFNGVGFTGTWLCYCDTVKELVFLGSAECSLDRSVDTFVYYAEGEIAELSHSELSVSNGTGSLVSRNGVYYGAACGTVSASYAGLSFTLKVVLPAYGAYRSPVRSEENLIRAVDGIPENKTLYILCDPALQPVWANAAADAEYLIITNPDDTVLQTVTECAAAYIKLTFADAEALNTALHFYVQEDGDTVLDSWVLPYAGDPLADCAARIGGTGYSTLSQALAAATDGDTVELLRSVSGAQYIVVRSGVTLDLCGYSLTGAELLYVTGSLVDSADTKGAFSADAYYLNFGEDTEFPVFNSANGSYSLFEMGFYSYKATANTYYFGYDYSTDVTSAANLMKADAAQGRVLAMVSASWTEGSGAGEKILTKTFTFTSGAMAEYLKDPLGSAFSITIGGISGVTAQSKFVVLDNNGGVLYTFAGPVWDIP